MNFTIYKNCQHNRFRGEICTIEANLFLEDFSIQKLNIYLPLYAPAKKLRFERDINP